MPLPLKVLVHRELTKEHGGHRIGTIALLWLWEEGPLDLRGAQGDVTDDPPRRGVGYDIHPREVRLPDWPRHGAGTSY